LGLNPPPALQPAMASSRISDPSQMVRHEFIPHPDGNLRLAPDKCNARTNVGVS
jgi:hypothetical protein